MAPTLLEIGRIERPHGVRGQVLVRLTTNRDERMRPGVVLTTAEGELRIEHVSRHHDRWIVGFAGVVDRPGADALRGRVLLAPPLEDPDELWVHDLIGAQVHDVDGNAHGSVVEVHANPASDLLVLDTGVLVPVRFVTHLDPGVRVVVDGPAGLLDPS